MFCLCINKLFFSHRNAFYSPPAGIVVKFTMKKINWSQTIFFDVFNIKRFAMEKVFSSSINISWWFFIVSDFLDIYYELWLEYCVKITWIELWLEYARCFSGKNLESSNLSLKLFTGKIDKNQEKLIVSRFFLKSKKSLNLRRLFKS